MRKIKIVAYGNDSGSKFWRLYDPFKYLRKKNIEAYVSDNAINEDEIQWADIIILQSITDKDGIALVYQYQKEKNKKIVVEVDDYYELNEDSPFIHEHKIYDAKFTITQTIKIADAVTTTTDALAFVLKTLNSKVYVLPNYIDLDRWNLPNLQNTTDKIRIGWAGSITHIDDLKIIEKPIKKLCSEFKNIQLVFIGDPRSAEIFKGCPVEIQLGVPFEAWPAKLRSLRLDIGLAPLRNTMFNRCKSNIKWIEYAIAGIPGVYSSVVYPEMGTRRFDGIFGMVADNEDQWYQCIKNYILCANLRNDIATRAYSCIITSYTLQTNINRWVDLYKKLIPKIKSDINTEVNQEIADPKEGLFL